MYIYIYIYTYICMYIKIFKSLAIAAYFSNRLPILYLDSGDLGNPGRDVQNLGNKFCDTGNQSGNLGIAVEIT